jgi:hypothetical protein
MKGIIWGLAACGLLFAGIGVGLADMDMQWPGAIAANVWRRWRNKLLAIA